MPEVSAVQRPYRWGKFQGWSNFVLGAGFSIFGAFGSSTSHRAAALIAGMVLTAIGAGLLARRRFALVLFFVWAVVVTWGLYILRPDNLVAFVVVSGWWGIPAIFYYPKRWREFGHTGPVSYTSVPARHPQISVAENGDDELERGMRYWLGVGARKSDSRAAAWFGRSAERGNSTAQALLGECYYYGHGVPKNLAFAAAWFRRAANQGDATAQFNLGSMYERGEGVQRDGGLAVIWLQKSAEQGCMSAQYLVGLLLMQGSLVPRDCSRAAKWLAEAARSGFADAQNNLGILYASGQGVNKDQKQAEFWFQKAAQQGNLEAESNLNLLRKFPEEFILELHEAPPQTIAPKQADTGAGQPSRDMNSNGLAAARAKADVVRRWRAVQQSADVARQQGIEKVDAEAVRNCRASAECGDTYAQHELGLRYKVGRGVVKSPAEALFWLSIAATAELKSDQQDYPRARDAVALMLSPAERNEVAREARKWIAAHVDRTRL